MSRSTAAERLRSFPNAAAELKTKRFSGGEYNSTKGAPPATATFPLGITANEFATFERATCIDPTRKKRLRAGLYRSAELNSPMIFEPIPPTMRTSPSCNNIAPCSARQQDIAIAK